MSLLVALSLVSGVCFQSGPATAQDDTVPIADAGVDLWSRVTEEYEVVVLSRGLLLEPLGDEVELLTIEIIDDRVAIDGQPVEAPALREQIGDEAADLVLELATMDPETRRTVFEQRREVEVEMVSEATSESSSEDAEEHRRERAQERDGRRYSDSQVSVGNSLTVEEDEVSKEALVFGGPLYVYGKVLGDAVAVGGPVTVSGEVTGDVAAIGSDVTLEAGAEVLGDVVSVGGEAQIDEEARVRGQIIEVPFGPNLRFGAWPRAIFGGVRPWDQDGHTIDLSPWGVATDFMWESFKLILLALLACLIMLVARRPLERVERKATAEPWKSGLVGLLVQILTAPLLVLVVLILVVSIIGIPLLLLVPFIILALILIAFLGYTGVALAVGRFLKRRFGWSMSNPYLVLLVGVLTIQVWSIVGDLLDFGWGPIWFFAVMFGVLGILVKYVAWTIGLGAAVLSRFGTADGWGGRDRVALPPEPTEPSPAQSPPAEPRDPREPSVLQDLGFGDVELPDSATGTDEEDDGTEPPPSTEAR